MLKYKKEVPTLVWARMKRLGKILCVPKKKRMAEQLEEGRIQILNLKKALVTEELNEQKLKLAMIAEDMEHKRQLNDLLKQLTSIKLEGCGDSGENRRRKSL